MELQILAILVFNQQVNIHLCGEYSLVSINIISKNVDVVNLTNH